MKGNITPEQQMNARALTGKWLADLRKAKGFSQKELAEIMGVEQGTVSKVESGKWAITIDMLALFCLHLEHPIDQLFTTKRNRKA